MTQRNAGPTFSVSHDIRLLEADFLQEIRSMIAAMRRQVGEGPVRDVLSLKAQAQALRQVGTTFGNAALSEIMQHIEDMASRGKSLDEREAGAVRSMLQRAWDISGGPGR